MAAGNTDAHLKNFGLVCADLSDVRLAPMFDMVTTKVYAPCRNATQRIAAGLEAASAELAAFGRARPEFGAWCARRTRPGRGCPARDAARQATR